MDPSTKPSCQPSSATWGPYQGGVLHHVVDIRCVLGIFLRVYINLHGFHGPLQNRKSSLTQAPGQVRMVLSPRSLLPDLPRQNFSGLPQVLVAKCPPPLSHPGPGHKTDCRNPQAFPAAIPYSFLQATANETDCHPISTNQEGQSRQATMRRTSAEGSRGRALKRHPESRRTAGRQAGRRAVYLGK